MKFTKFLAFFFLLKWRLAASAGADFLLMDLNARSMAQAGALGAGDQGLSQLRHNPAALGQLPRQSFLFTHIESFGAWTHDWIAWARPAQVANFAVELQWSRLKPFPYFDDQGREAGSLEAGSQLLGLGLARPVLGSSVQAGIEAKAFRSQLAEFSNSGAAVDFGLHGHAFNRAFSAGICVRNAGFQTAFYQEVEPLPLQMGAFAAIEAAPADHFAFRLGFGEAAYADLYRPNETGAAGQITFFQKISFRAGIKTAGPWTSQSFGGGLDLGFGELSYAFLPNAFLGATHAVTLEWNNLPWID